MNSKVKYILRVDGNASIGIGHIMRTLTVADALMETENSQTMLILCSDSDSVSIVATRGYKAYCLGTDYRDLMSEVSLWQRFGISNSCILVDSYLVSNEYLNAISRYGKVFLFDDMQKEKYDVHGIINYSAFVDKVAYQQLYGNECNCYLGGQYMPIRKTFAQRKWKLRDTVSDILITTGGGDPLNISEKIYTLLSGILPNNISYHVVAGAFNPFIERLKTLSVYNDNLIIHHDVKDLGSIMEMSDLAISAGGSTMYELATVGVPTLCFSYAENQELFCKNYGEYVSDYAGAYNIDPQATLNNIADLIVNKYLYKTYREKCSNVGKNLIDGKGALRLAQILIDSYSF